MSPPHARRFNHGRDPITWNHVIEKESLNLKELEHVGIEKVETFSGHALGSLAISGNLAEKIHRSRAPARSHGDRVLLFVNIRPTNRVCSTRPGSYAAGSVPAGRTLAALAIG
jgi:hypothetical protein